MKNKFAFFPVMIIVVLFSFLVISSRVFASVSSGTIDSTYHYAWGENVGWVDFANVAITDTGLSGSIYGENIGWIDLSTITNTSAGDLSGYAWGENVGWVDFGPSYIGTEGVFYGSIYGENIGWIIFGAGGSNVFTDWRPLSNRGTSSSNGVVGLEFVNNSGGGGGGSYVPPITPPTLPVSEIKSCVIIQTLRQGNKGEQVKCLQNKLNILSDGVFGRKTKQAVVVFQKNHDLKTDGVVGPLTRAVINK